jgi:predicted class III extradiol MEMO1 family dioxygenase
MRVSIVAGGARTIRVRVGLVRGNTIRVRHAGRDILAGLRTIVGGEIKDDREMLARIEAFDPEAVLEAEARQVGFACGRAAVAAVLWAARDLGADRVELLSYATSGDVSGDFSSVVGYGAAAILRSNRD